MGDVVVLNEFKKERLAKKQQLNDFLSKFNPDKFVLHNLSLDDLREEISRLGFDPDEYEKVAITFLRKHKEGYR